MKDVLNRPLEGGAGRSADKFAGRSAGKFAGRSADKFAGRSAGKFAGRFPNRYKRQLPLLGESSTGILKAKSVLICGLGGVGGYVLEALVRSGVGTLVAADCDSFEESNLNRQLLCTANNIGTPKAEAAAKRAREIDPDINISAEILLLDEATVPALLERCAPDYIADATDDVCAKLCLASEAQKRGIPLISCMGTGNKLQSNAFLCADISETSVCPLAKAMRKRLRESGVEHLKVVYSREKPLVKGPDIGSVSFVPAAAGMLMAEEIIKDLLSQTCKQTQTDAPPDTQTDAQTDAPPDTQTYRRTDKHQADTTDTRGDRKTDRNG